MRADLRFIDALFWSWSLFLLNAGIPASSDGKKNSAEPDLEMLASFLILGAFVCFWPSIVFGVGADDVGVAGVFAIVVS